MDGIGAMAGYKIGGNGSPSRDRLVYVTTCFIGHHVEVRVQDGSIYSGIFHSTNPAEKTLVCFFGFDFFKEIMCLTCSVVNQM